MQPLVSRFVFRIIM